MDLAGVHLPGKEKATRLLKWQMLISFIPGRWDGPLFERGQLKAMPVFGWPLPHRPSLTSATAPFNLCPCERQTLVQAETDWVFIDAKTGQALAIPDAIKSAFQVVAIGEESWLQSHD